MGEIKGTKLEITSKLAQVIGRNGTFKLHELEVYPAVNGMTYIRPINNRGDWMQAGFNNLNKEDVGNLILLLSQAHAQMTDE